MLVNQTSSQVHLHDAATSIVSICGKQSHHREESKQSWLCSFVHVFILSFLFVIVWPISNSVLADEHGDSELKTTTPWEVFGRSVENRPLELLRWKSPSDSNIAIQDRDIGSGTAPSSAVTNKVLVVKDPACPQTDFVDFVESFTDRFVEGHTEKTPHGHWRKSTELLFVKDVNPDRSQLGLKLGDESLVDERKSSFVRMAKEVNAMGISLSSDWFRLDAPETRYIVQLLHTENISHILIVCDEGESDFESNLTVFAQSRNVKTAKLDWRNDVQALANGLTSHSISHLPEEHEQKVAPEKNGSESSELPRFLFLPLENSWAASRLRLQGIEMDRVTLSPDWRRSKLVRYSVAVVGSEKRTGKITDGSTSQSDSIHEKKPASRLPASESIRLQRLLEATASGDGKIDSLDGWLISTEQPLGKLVNELLWGKIIEQQLQLSENSLASSGYFASVLKPGSIYPVVGFYEFPSVTSTQSLAPLAVPHDANHSAETLGISGERLSLEKLYSAEHKVTYFGPLSSLPQWLSGTNQFLQKRGDQHCIVDAETGDEQLFSLSGELEAALMKQGGLKREEARDAVSKHNFGDASREVQLIEHQNALYLFRTKQKNLTCLVEKSDIEKKFATLSPDGKWVGYVQDNNLYVVDVPSGKTKQLTRDGSEELLNGHLDWVYQEELYGRGNFRGFWFSPNSEYIAFLRLDQSPVPKFVIDDSIPFAQSVESMRYPKAGQLNPIVTLQVVELSTGNIESVPLGDYSEDDRLIVKVDWSDASESLLTYQIQNRIQSELEVWLYDANACEGRKLLREESIAWVDVLDSPRQLPDGDWLWMTETEPSPALNGRRHLVRVDKEGVRKPVTQGEWDLKELLWVDPNGNRAIATAKLSSRIDTNLIEIDLQSGEAILIGEEHGTYRASVHPDGKFILVDWSDMRTPNESWLLNRAGEKIRFISGPPSDRLQYMAIVEPEYLTIPARDGFEMEAMLYRPRGNVDNPNEKSPVLIHVYAGPRAPSVVNRATYRNDLWHRWLADQGIAVLLCDNRSALGHGVKDSWLAYKDLGKIELRDLEDVVGWLHQQDGVAKDRIGIWGWSYGGYFTSYAMTHTKLFRAGISGAPVTDWRNYDSIYTERFMSTPQLNPEGYRSSSSVEAAKNLHGRMLIIHGEIDENVHMTNALQLAYALQKAGKQFDLMVYPKNRHSITDPAQQEHMYRMMSEFLLKHLKE